MSDTVLALGITVLLLAALAAWVPLLSMAEKLISLNSQHAARRSSSRRECVSAVQHESLERDRVVVR